MSYGKTTSAKGFTLIEILISLSLFLIVILASLEFLMTVKDHFFNLKKVQESNIAAFAALDKMRMDFQDSGQGLLIPQRLGIVSCVELDGERISIRKKDKDLVLLDDLTAGSTRLSLHSTSGVKKGQELIVHDGHKGEMAAILSVHKTGVVFASPISFSYSKMISEVIVVKQTSFYLDHKSRILRRKVNSSPAQPLLEGAEVVVFKYEIPSNLINTSVTTSEDKTYEISIFPKNLYLANPQTAE